MLEQLTTWLAGDGAEDLVPSHLEFNVSFAPQWCFVLLLGAGVLSAIFFWYRLAGLKWPARSVLVALRVAVIVLALFLVLDPSVIAQRVHPGEQIVILLFDDSQSMRISGASGRSRGERMVRAYTAAMDEFERSIERKHQVARYRFGGSIEPIQDLSALAFAESESNLVGSVIRVLSEFQGTPVSAVIVFSDGVQQTEDLTASLDDLPEGVAIYTVGVDTRSAWSDAEVSRLSVKRTDLDKSPVSLTVHVRSLGMAGHQAVVEAVEGNRVVAEHRIEISDSDQDHSVRLDFVPAKEGWLKYEARVRISEGDARGIAAGSPAKDRISQNNTRSFVVDNRKKTYKILYVSGRPSWENKFVRRALEADERLEMTSIIAISNAAPKFVFRGKSSNIANPLFDGFEEERDRPRYDEAVILRLGPDAKKLSGYPTDARALFEYDLVVFGDIEREFFTAEQLDLTRDFVEKRGGSLLVMGGPNSFTEGHYSGTILEGMLPVAMYPDYEKSEVTRVEEPFEVEPTAEGTMGGSWAFSTEHDLNQMEWKNMPELFGLNRFLFVRPGATVMARTLSTRTELEGQPFFVVQRYGEGRCAVLATSDTWQWQLGLDEADQKHERLWRQTVRYLVHDTPSANLLRNKRDEYIRGEPVELEFVLRDALFERREGLQCTLRATTPSGGETDLSVEESIQSVGVYTARFVPEESGLYTLRLRSFDEDDEVVGFLEEVVLVEDDRKEFLGAEYDADFLEDVARAGRGQFFALDRLGELADLIPVPVRSAAEEVRLHLWHQPVFYCVLVLFMITEWYMRRRRGHA